MKAIARVDAHLDTQRLIAQAVKEEAQRRKNVELDRLAEEKYNSPEKVEKRRQWEIDYQKKKERIRKQRKINDRKERKEHARNFLNSDSKFKWADRVVVSDPRLEACGEHGEHFRGLRGRVKLRNCCKCVHTFGKNCYYVTLTSTGKRHHFEEIELSLAEESK